MTKETFGCGTLLPGYSPLSFGEWIPPPPVWWPAPEPPPPPPPPEPPVPDFYVEGYPVDAVNIEIVQGTSLQFVHNITGLYGADAARAR